MPTMSIVLWSIPFWYILTSTTPWANSADNKLMIFFLVFLENMNDISCRSFPLETILHEMCNSVSWKKEKNISNVTCWNFYPAYWALKMLLFIVNVEVDWIYTGYCLWYDDNPLIYNICVTFYTSPHDSGRVLWFHIVSLCIHPFDIRRCVHLYFYSRKITWVNINGYVYWYCGDLVLDC